MEKQNTARALTLNKMVINIDGHLFVKEYDILSQSDRVNLISVIDNIIEKGYVINDPSVPPVQTPPDLHVTLKYCPEFVRLIKKASEIVNHYFDESFIVDTCWANISNEENRYDWHTHTSDASVVYYLKNTWSQHGTYIDKKIIFPGDQNSLLIFNGKINHSIVNMPAEIGKNDQRYSIAFDLLTETNYGIKNGK